MLRHGRLGDPELRLDDRGDLSRGQLAVSEQLQDPSPDRVSEYVERVHGGEIISSNLYKSRMKIASQPQLGGPTRDQGLDL